MSHMACPMCIANTSIEAAWSLMDPAHLDEWWDAKTRLVTPQGPLAPGQRIEATTGPLGIFTVTLDVLEVDPGAHRVRFLSRLPFGVLNDQTTIMTPLGPDQCRISFG